MLRCVLRAKIHRATVTESNLDYEGSITIDSGLLKKAGIAPYEQVLVSNLNNGERFETYAIPGKKGEICLNGPTARKGVAGDKIIIFSYGYVDEKTLRAGIKPIILRLDSKNRLL
ncbi:MAG: aspartate 1-decarboxylase [Thermodesulfovibrionales bacterium]|nr:aspartate 1-decarboxylase [Thermodesulfovibrionales bacterium]